MVDNNKNKQGEPLLYIDQPNFEKPIRTMQESFYSGDPADFKEMNQMKTLKTTKPNTGKKGNFSEPLGTLPMPNFESSSSLEEASTVQNQSPVSAVDYFKKNVEKSKKGWRLIPVKSFKDMSINEKLQYLSSFPSGQPPYPCEFLSNNETIKGILNEWRNDQISIKTFDNQIKTLPVQDLQAIRIIF